MKSKHEVLSTQYPTALEQALAYAEAGIRVFPVRVSYQNGKWVKTPALRKPADGPGGHHEATTDPEVIRGWFEGKRGRVVGLPATANGLLILDLDGEEGVETFEALEDDHGEVSTFATSSGPGQHLYFRDPGEPIKNRARVLPSIDVRTQGWVVAPSAADAPGKTYEVVDGAPFAEVPGWLLEVLREGPAPLPSPAAGETVGEGVRNETLSRLAFRLRKAGLSVEEIEAALTARNRSLSPPLDAAEVAQIARGKAAIVPEPVAEEAIPALGRVLIKAGLVAPDPASYGEFRDALGRPRVKGLPDAKWKVVKDEKVPAAAQSPTAQNTLYIAQALGMRLRFDLMAGEVALQPPAHARAGWYESRSPDVQRKAALAAVTDWAHKLGISAVDQVRNHLLEFSGSDPFHPAEDWILSRPWDGVDRFEALWETITLTDPRDAPLMRVFLRKWLLQAVEAIRGWRRESMKEMVLVFVGPQGCGKTTWIGSLLPDGMAAHGASLHLGGGGAAQRDSIHTAISSPIVELGELDVTFRKSDISALKSFLSQTVDRYRPPYARSDIVRPRCTVFAGSVNDEQFLQDVTGNRRFLVMSVSRLNGFHGIDLQQLWAQLSVAWEAGESFRLTAEEQALQHDHGEHFRATSEPEDCFWEYFGPILEGTYVGELKEVIVNSTAVAKVVDCKTDKASLGVVTRLMNEAYGPRRPRIKGVRRAWVCKVRSHDAYRVAAAPGTKLTLITDPED